MKKNFLILSLLSLSITAVNMPASATPLNVTELIDYSNSNGSGVIVGNFDEGINIISGSVKRDSFAQVGFGDYGDFFRVNLLAGFRITSISIEITNHSGENGFFVGAADNKIGAFSPPAYNAQTYANLSGDGFYNLSPTVGTYPFDPAIYYFGVATNVGTNTGYSYKWITTVESVSVPEPVSLGLLGLGLIGMGYSRNRKKPKISVM